MSKSIQRVGLPLSVGLLGFLYLLYGVFETFHSAREILNIFNWLSGKQASFQPTAGNTLQPLLPPVLALVGLGLWLRSGVARSLALGVSYLGISAGVLTVLLSVLSPQALDVILGRIKDAEAILELSQGAVVGLGLLLLLFGTVQYGILMANKTRRAFNFS